MHTYVLCNTVFIICKDRCLNVHSMSRSDNGMRCLWNTKYARKNTHIRALFPPPPTVRQFDSCYRGALDFLSRQPRHFHRGQNCVLVNTLSIIQNLKLNRKSPITRKVFEHTTCVEYKKKIQKYSSACRYQRPRGLKRGSAAARFLGLRIRIPPVAWMSVCSDRCVLSGRGLCDVLIKRPEESYRVVCVCMFVCNREA